MAVDSIERDFSASDTMARLGTYFGIVNPADFDLNRQQMYLRRCEFDPSHRIS
jgi:hypothetical protein